jgi:L-alanine-DL-glutamate epimerase-like enolase superfamily enzyme
MRIDHISTDLLRFKLAKPVGGSGVAFVDVLIVDVVLDNGVSGLGFSYVLSESGAIATNACRKLASMIEGGPFHHPAASWSQLCGTLNRTGLGPNLIGLAAIDIALWDAYAKSIGQPLGCAMGGAPRPVKVYASSGYYSGQPSDETVEATRRWISAGFEAVKLRVDGCLAAIDVLGKVREVARGAEVMCDANEKCSPSQASRLLHAAREHRLLFVEEPLPACDVDGYIALAQAYPGVIAAGEHLQGVQACIPFAAGKACSTFQPDLAMIGGLTPALDLSRTANAYGVEVAPHFLPGLFIHLAAASPNVRWLEHFPLIEPLFEGWPELVQGRMQMRALPGHGLEIADGARTEFATST